MSKIGRKPIQYGKTVVEIKGQEIHYKGPKAQGIYLLPDTLKAHVENGTIVLTVARQVRDVNREWGLHRARLANALIGADRGFEKQLKIVGLGFKAVQSAGKIQFQLGYSHKVDFPVNPAVTVEIDKTGQLLTLRSYDKELLGHVGSEIRSLRLPEPYKGTGIQYTNEVIIRKAGKAKSA
jgi:large subunit ribosomal protein L6